METIINEFKEIAANPEKQLAMYKAQGKKSIGVLPYYAPEELVYAGGMPAIGGSVLTWSIFGIVAVMWIIAYKFNWWVPAQKLMKYR